jgi:GT2 family glycosyltransferase
MTGPVSVVVVNYNCGEDLVSCVHSWVTSEARPKVVVVDNASSDGSVDVLRAHFPHVDVIQNEKNLGLAAANNQGIAATSSPFVLMCNPDVRPIGDTLGEIARFFEDHPRAAIVGARMYDELHRLRASVADIPRLRDGIRGNYWWTSWPHDTERAVGQVMEACYAVRRSAITETGALDPGYFLYWEGADWAYRLAANGWQTWFCPTAEVVHIGGATTTGRPWRRILWSHRSAYRFYSRHTRVPAPVLAAMFAARTLVKWVMEATVGTDSQVPMVRVP